MKPVLLDKFKGLRNDVDPTAFEPGDMTVASNVDIEETGKLQRRGGYAQVRAGSSHSLWAKGDLCLFVSGTTLYRLKPDFTTTVLASGLAAGLPLSYMAPGNGLVYWANGVDSGVTDGVLSRPWGIQPPEYQPMASNIGGELYPGLYQYAMTFVADDGRESGTGQAGVTQITGGGIAFSQMEVSTDPTVTHKRVYLTAANGEQLYLALVVPAAATSASYTANTLSLQTPLETQLLLPPVAGQVVASFMGRALVASENVLFVSNGLSYELFNVLEHYAFDSRINVVAPLQDGCFIGTETEILWAGGRDPDKWSFVRKAVDRAVPGTLVFAPATEVLESAEDEATVALWVNDSGICIGLNGGGLTNISEGKHSFDSPLRGAGLFRAQGSLNNYVGVLSY
jgi:hypothetical protein